MSSLWMAWRCWRSEIKSDPLKKINLLYSLFDSYSMIDEKRRETFIFLLNTIGQILSYQYFNERYGKRIADKICELIYKDTHFSILKYQKYKISLDDISTVCLTSIKNILETM